LKTPPEWFLEQMSDARKLSAISRGVRRLLEEKGTGGGGVPVSRTRVEEAPRCEVVVVEAEAERQVPLSKGVLVVTDDGHGVARKLVDEIRSRGGLAAVLDDGCLGSRESCASAIESLRQRFGTVAGIAHLKPIADAPIFPGISHAEWTKRTRDEVDSMLFLLQAVLPELRSAGETPFLSLCASRGGGDYQDVGEASSEECRHPWRGGLAGLLKTAAKEFPAARFRQVDYDVLPSAARIREELLLGGPVEIGYRGGRRLSLFAVRREIAGPEGGAPPSSKSVFLVTGGARGITGKVSAYLASRVPARFVLVGRSPHPVDEEDAATRGLPGAKELRGYFASELSRNGGKPRPRDVEAAVQGLLAAREIRATLAQIRGCRAEAEYLSCDVRDVESFRKLLGGVRERYGSLDFFLHGAGVIEDKLLADKSAESFDRVLETKISPLLTLVEACAPELPAMVLFSSVAGFFGNAGQGDYAAANEILNRMARRLGNPRLSVSMNWGPWEGAGMVAPEVADQFRARGIGLVPLERGVTAVWNELSFGGRRDLRVLIGAGPWVVESEAIERRSAAAVAAGSGV
jgi:NAD(P)-dependent dehydrogenase (short-subunit alcohol dehydrogenase family)